MSETNEPKKRPGGRRATRDDVKAAARVLYETVAGMTEERVAKEIGVTRATVQSWAIEEKWTSAPAARPEKMSKLAQQVADKYTSEVAQYGPDATPEAKFAAVTAVAVDHGVTLRAAIIDRHRKEWAGPRALAYEGLKEKSESKLRAAKIAADAIRIIQEGERKAWGLDPADPEKPAMLVIERE